MATNAGVEPWLFFFFFFFAKAVEQQVAISAASNSFAPNAAVSFVTSWLFQGFIVCKAGPDGGDLSPV